MLMTVSREFITKIESKEALRKVFIVMLNHENRIRVLEGKPEITKEQFIQALKSL